MVSSRFLMYVKRVGLKWTQPDHSPPLLPHVHVRRLVRSRLGFINVPVRIWTDGSLTSTGTHLISTCQRIVSSTSGINSVCRALRRRSILWDFQLTTLSFACPSRSAVLISTLMRVTVFLVIPGRSQWLLGLFLNYSHLVVYVKFIHLKLLLTSSMRVTVLTCKPGSFDYPYDLSGGRELQVTNSSYPSSSRTWSA